MSAFLRGKPELKWGQVWCVKCNCEANFEYTAVHRGFTKKGMLLVNVSHHNEKEEIIIEFDEMDRHPDRRIDAFVPPKQAALEQPAQLSLPESSQKVIDI